MVFCLTSAPCIRSGHDGNRLIRRQIDCRSAIYVAIYVVFYVVFYVDNYVDTLTVREFCEVVEIFSA